MAWACTKKGYGLQGEKVLGLELPCIYMTCCRRKRGRPRRIYYGCITWMLWRRMWRRLGWQGRMWKTGGSGEVWYAVATPNGNSQRKKKTPTCRKFIYPYSEFILYWLKILSCGYACEPLWAQTEFWLIDPSQEFVQFTARNISHSAEPINSGSRALVRSFQ